MTAIVKDRYQWWPVRIRWRRRAALKILDWHGWQTGTESTGSEDHSESCSPGWRRVFGQTFHIGPLKVMLGDKTIPAAAEHAPPKGT